MCLNPYECIAFPQKNKVLKYEKKGRLRDMSSLNVEGILTGTPEKVFATARKELVADYNETSANEFFYSYCEEPLSFILSHSREIFSETYFGYDFYRDLIDHYTYDPRTYATEAVKVRAYIDLAKKQNVPDYQLAKYDELLELLIQYDATYRNLAKALQIGGSSENGEEFLTLVFDYLYEIDRHKTSADDGEAIMHMMDNAAETIFGMDNVYLKVVVGLIFAYRNPSYTSYLIEACRNIMHKTETSEAIGNIQRLQDCVRLLLKDDAVIDMVKSIGAGPDGLYYHWMNLAARSDGLAAHIASKKAEDRVFDIAEGIGDALEDAILQVESVTESEDINDAMLCAKYDNYKNLQAIYEAKVEAASVEENELVLENAEDLLTNAESELYYMEWEDDGSPNAVIQKHIMTSKEREALAKQKESEKNTLQKIVAQHNAETAQKEESESTLCEKIKADIEKAGNIDGIAAAGGTEQSINGLLKNLRSNLDTYRDEAKKADYKRALNLCDDLEDEIKVNDPTYESYDSDLDRELAMFLEDDNTDTTDTTADTSKDDKKDSDTDKDAGSEEPKKPKTDFATKIQNKALDKAAKDESRMAKASEKTQKLKNAANAVSSTPKTVAGNFKKMAADFEKWDDNRRKEFLLKPGYRHKIFKTMRDAIVIGSVASMNFALVPFMGLIKHCSKLKDKRIRNELAKELESEIRICEEKISDANSSEDKQTKYELMRIKDKLEAEKVRVRINSNYM